jgi:MFS family permease
MVKSGDMHTEPGPPTPTDPRPLTNVLIMSFGFFLTYGGFNPIQSFASSLLNFQCVPIGDISIGLIYAAGALTSLFAPTIVGRYGPRACMLYSSIGFVLFAASVAYIVLPVVIVASIALGICGALFNISQGVALGHCVTDQTRGLYSGIFQALNQGATLPGNLIAIFVIPPTATEAVLRPCGNTTEALLVPGWDTMDGPLFVGCGACCLLGTLVLALYRSPPTTISMNTPSSELSVMSSLRRIWMACTRREGILLLVPLMIYSGVSNAFWSGMFTRQMPSGWVGPAMCILGGGEILGGLVIGPVLDRTGAPASFAMIVLVQCGALALAYFANIEEDQTKFWIAAGLLGVADNGTQTLAYATLTNRFVEPDGGIPGKALPTAVTTVETGSSIQSTVVDAIHHHADVATPLLQEHTDAEKGLIMDTSIGFASLGLTQSLTIAILFLTLPLAAEPSGRSSETQFLYEVAAAFGIMVFAAICLFIDGGGHHSTRLG